MRKWRLPALPAERLLRRRNELLPLCFVFSSTLNLCFFYLGFGFEENIVRHFGFILGCVLFAVCCGLALLALLRERCLSLRTLLLLCAPLLFFAACFAVAFLKFGLHQGSMLRYLGQFVCFALPAFFAGICAAAEGGEKRFFSVLESASFLAVPGALIYTNSVMFNCLPWNYNANLGVLNYMTMAYTFMPYLLAHMISFIRGGVPWTIPFTGKPIKRSQLLRGVLIALYWMAIIASATRGALVCVMFFCVLLTALELTRRTATAKRAAAVSVVMVALLLFNLFIYAPPGLYRINRMNVFLEGVARGQLVPASKNKNTDSAAEWIDELVRADGGRQLTNFPEDLDPLEIDPDDIATWGLRVGSRNTLFKLAYKDFLRSPLMGMSPGGFSLKYGTYPHAVLLELLCETGLVGAVVLLALLLRVLCRMVSCSICREGKKNLEMQYLLLFFFAYALQANISGTIWHCPALMAAMGFGPARSRTAPGQCIAVPSGSEEVV